MVFDKYSVRVYNQYIKGKEAADMAQHNCQSMNMSVCMQMCMRLAALCSKPCAAPILTAGNRHAH